MGLRPRHFRSVHLAGTDWMVEQRWEHRAPPAPPQQHRPFTSTLQALPEISALRSLSRSRRRWEGARTDGKCHSRFPRAGTPDAANS